MVGWFDWLDFVVVLVQYCYVGMSSWHILLPKCWFWHFFSMIDLCYFYVRHGKAQMSDSCIAMVVLTMILGHSIGLGNVIKLLQKIYASL